MDDVSRHKRFAIAMTALGEYYDRDLSDAVIDLYAQGLDGYEIEAIEHAIRQHLGAPESGQFFPKIADLVRQIEGTGREASFLAWTKVDQAVRMIGRHESVVFDDPIIHQVIEDMGGWVALGEKQEKEWPFVAREFQARYQEYRGRNPNQEVVPRKLIGVFEAENMSRGFDAPPPRLIGDQKKAAAILAGHMAAIDGRRREVKQLTNRLFAVAG